MLNVRFRTLLLAALVALGSFQLAEAKDPRLQPTKITHRKVKTAKKYRAGKYKAPKQGKFKMPKQKKYKKPKNHV